MALQVTIHKIDQNFEDKIVGSITLDQNELHVEPPNDQMMQRMAKDPVLDPMTRKMVSPEQNPRQWLHALKYQYASAYLRASEPVEINRPPQTPPAWSGKNAIKSPVLRSDVETPQPPPRPS